MEASADQSETEEEGSDLNWYWRQLASSICADWNDFRKMFIFPDALRTGLVYKNKFKS